MITADGITARVAVDQRGCWLWQRARNSAGYGVVHYRGRLAYAHRVSYEFAKGAIPAGLDLDHLCRTRACVNPDHLEPVTRLENMRRSPYWLGNRTSCPSGHPYSPENTVRERGGSRRCRTCRNAKGGQRA